LVVNPVTIAAMLKFRVVKKSRAYLFILNQSFVDFVTGIGSLLRYSAALMWWEKRSVESSIELSWVASIILNPMFIASLFTSFIIGVDRALATMNPLVYKRRVTVRASLLTLMLMWAFVGGAFVIPMVVNSIEVHRTGRPHFAFNPTVVYPDNFTTYFGGPLLMFCLISNVLLYALVLGAYMRMARKVAASSGEAKKRRITRLCIVTVGAALVSWMPAVILGAVPTPHPSTRAMVMYQTLSDIFSAMTLPICYANNIFYAYYQKDIREACARLFNGASVHPMPESSIDQSHSTASHAT
jgi:hypothetical protein